MRDDEIPSNLGTPLLSRGFDRWLIGSVRHAVAAHAAAAGLRGQRLDDFILAVNEMMTNAVRHAGGAGSLILSCVDGSLSCHVSDAGPGIPLEQVNGHPVPATLALSGRGLWLARKLCDRVDIETGPGGTRVRLLVEVPA
jgi:serine/threonine-protein kinase RsbW